LDAGAIGKRIGEGEGKIIVLEIDGNLKNGRKS
jgi:hypothetical protein